PHPQRRQGLRSSGARADEVRARDQSQGCEGAGPRHAHDAACPCRRGDRMNRRAFITVLGGAALVCPFTAGAQQARGVRRVGVLSNPGLDDAEMQIRTAAFVQTLQELGWTVGRDLQIDYRWSYGNADRLRAHAAELVALAPNVILATSGVSILPLVQAS